MIGERLKLIRKQKNLSQKAVAELLSTSSGYISEVEQGKTIPGGKFLHSLNRVFSVSIDWILTGEGPPLIIKKEDVLDDGETPAKNMVELQHVNLLCGFVDNSRALNINRQLMVLEKLDPDALIRIESYIKGTIDTVKETIKRKSEPVHDRRQSQRRVLDDPDQAPNGEDRRSGLDRRVAFG